MSTAGESVGAPVRCVACLYDLGVTATGDRCPECGLHVSVSVGRTQFWPLWRLTRARWTLLAMIAAAVLALPSPAFWLLAEFVDLPPEAGLFDLAARGVLLLRLVALVIGAAVAIMAASCVRDTPSAPSTRRRAFTAMALVVAALIALEVAGRLLWLFVTPIQAGPVPYGPSLSAIIALPQPLLRTVILVAPLLLSLTLARDLVPSWRAVVGGAIAMTVVAGVGATAVMSLTIFGSGLGVDTYDFWRASRLIRRITSTAAVIAGLATIVVGIRLVRAIIQRERSIRSAVPTANTAQSP